MAGVIKLSIHFYLNKLWSLLEEDFGNGFCDDLKNRIDWGYFCLKGLIQPVLVFSRELEPL